MTTRIVDTSVLVDWLRERGAAADLIHGAAAHGDVLAGSVLSRFELLAGTRRRERDALSRVLRTLTWVPVTSEIADRAGQLAAELRRAHSGIDHVDYVIAATAELLGAELWTRNVKHFPMFPELRAPY